MKTHFIEEDYCGQNNRKDQPEKGWNFYFANATNTCPNKKQEDTEISFFCPYFYPKDKRSRCCSSRDSSGNCQGAYIPELPYICKDVDRREEDGGNVILRYSEMEGKKVSQIAAIRQDAIREPGDGFESDLYQHVRLYHVDDYQVLVVVYPNKERRQSHIVQVDLDQNDIDMEERNGFLGFIILIRLFFL